MIAKRIDIEPENDNFERLADYIAAAPEEGEKLDDLWIVNCDAGETVEDLPLAIKEVKATQALNQTAKSGKTYHLMVSFRDERPSPKALRDIEREFAQALGFGDHQRIAGTHINTENFHLHIAVNKIHPVTLKAHTPFRDFKVLEKVSREMEKKYGLKVDLGRADKIEPEKQAARARDKEAHTWEQSFDGYVREEKDQLMAALDAAGSWHDLHQAFQRLDIELRPRGNGLVIANASGVEMIKASALDRKFSKSVLEHRFGAFVPPGEDLSADPAIETTEGPAGDGHEGGADVQEQPGIAQPGGAGQDPAGGQTAGQPDSDPTTTGRPPRGRPGFKTRLQLHRAEIATTFRSAQSWEQLHSDLTRYGMVLRPRGNGLSLAASNGRGMIKASAIHRNFSMASLQARLGPFQAAPQASQAQAPQRAGQPAPGARLPRPPRPVKRYRRRPITRYPGQHRLWRRYMATQGKKRESLAVKAFKTWKEFLQAEALNDPLAMAIIVAQRKLLAALNPFSGLPRGNFPAGSHLNAARPRTPVSVARPNLPSGNLVGPQSRVPAPNRPASSAQRPSTGSMAPGVQNSPHSAPAGRQPAGPNTSPALQRSNLPPQGRNPAAGLPAPVERRLLAAVSLAARGDVLPVDRHWVNQALAGHPTLSDRQRASVCDVVDRRLTLITQGNQVERREVLSTALAAFSAAGLRVLGAAPSDQASKDLQDAAGIASGSLHILDWRLARGELQLGRHDVLVIEAGQVHAKQISRVLEAVAPTGARMVLIDSEVGTGPSALLHRLTSMLNQAAIGGVEVPKKKQARGLDLGPKPDGGLGR
jgi:hypothetical protein